LLLNVRAGFWSCVTDPYRICQKFVNALVAFLERRSEILVPNHPYLAAFKAARAFFTNRAGISASALRCGKLFQPDHKRANQA